MMAVLYVFNALCAPLTGQGPSWMMSKSCWRAAPAVSAPPAPPMPPSLCPSLRRPPWKPRPSPWPLSRVCPEQSHAFSACTDVLPPPLKRRPLVRPPSVVPAGYCITFTDLGGSASCFQKDKSFECSQLPHHTSRFLLDWWTTAGSLTIGLTSRSCHIEM